MVPDVKVTISLIKTLGLLAGDFSQYYMKGGKL